MSNFGRDFDAYERALPRLLQEHGEGHFVLIHRSAVEEIFPSQDAAMDAGYARHGIGNFFVKKILFSDLEDSAQHVAACRG